MIEEFRKLVKDMDEVGRKLDAIPTEQPVSEELVRAADAIRRTAYDLYHTVNRFLDG